MTLSPAYNCWSIMFMRSVLVCPQIVPQKDAILFICLSTDVSQNYHYKS